VRLENLGTRNKFLPKDRGDEGKYPLEIAVSVGAVT